MMCVGSFLYNSIFSGNFCVENICLRCVKEIFRKETIKKYGEDVSFRFIKIILLYITYTKIFNMSLSCL